MTATIVKNEIIEIRNIPTKLKRREMADLSRVFGWLITTMEGEKPGEFVLRILRETEKKTLSTKTIENLLI